MRYSIFDFNQQKAVEAGLDLTDILLLQYVKDAACSPAMEHKFDESQNLYYVWLHHEKILSDLPILGIKKDRLNQRLSALCEKGLLQSIQVCNSGKRGSKSFYALSQKTTDLLYSSEGPAVKNYMRNDDQVSKITPENERPAVKNYTSDSKLEKNKQLNNNIENNFHLGNPRSSTIKKPNLYQKCIAMIMQFTEDKNLQDKLKEYLALRLDMKDKQLYANSWKGILNALQRFMDDGEDPIEILDQSIQRGYAQVYSVNKKKSRKTNKYVDDIPEGINGTHEHYEGDHSLSELVF